MSHITACETAAFELGLDLPLTIAEEVDAFAEAVGTTLAECASIICLGEGVVDAVKRIIAHIREMMVRFWEWITGKSRASERQADEEISRNIAKEMKEMSERLRAAGKQNGENLRQRMDEIHRQAEARHNPSVTGCPDPAVVLRAVKKAQSSDDGLSDVLPIRPGAADFASAKDAVKQIGAAMREIKAINQGTVDTLRDGSDKAAVEKAQNLQRVCFKATGILVEAEIRINHGRISGGPIDLSGPSGSGGRVIDI